MVLLSDKISFKELADFFESFDQKKCTKSVRSKRLKDLLEKSRLLFRKIHGTLKSDDPKAQGDSIYSVVRLLLPRKDRGRGAYGFQSQSLGRMLGEILGVSDAMKKKFQGCRDVNLNESRGHSEKEDLPSLVYKVMQKSFSSNQASSMSLNELHAVLDKLAPQNNEEESPRKYKVASSVQKTILRDLFTKHRISPVEGKWICKILLKKLQIFSDKEVFHAIHKDAEAIAKTKTGDLEKFCQLLNDPSVNAHDVSNTVALFWCSEPMLCQRVISLDEFEIRDSKTVGSVRKATRKATKDKQDQLAPPFVVETKWDGERFQIHYNGQTIKYFSRRGYDFTATFDETLTTDIRKLIRSSCTSFILDGEMMAWNKKRKTFTQKGAQIDVKRMKPDNPNHKPVFVAFDVLYYNGETQISKPLKSRIEVLHQVMDPLEGVYLITSQKIVETKEEIEDALNEAIDNLEEGLIVKSFDSVYCPGERNITWLKIKPEYIADTTIDDLDLLILGIYYASENQSNAITHFLVGVIKTTDSVEEFFPVAQVGRGRLKQPELNALVEYLKPRLQKNPDPSVKYKGRKRPDAFINPKDSIVVTVKASEINRSDTYVINYNLRFPRITNVRQDKRYKDVMTFDEFLDLYKRTAGKLAKRTDATKSAFRTRRDSFSASDSSNSENEREKNRFSSLAKSKKTLTASSEPQSDDPETNNNSEHIPGPSRSRRTTALRQPSAANIVLSPSKRITLKSNLFENDTFCVYGSSDWKRKMEDEIKAHAGTIVQNPVSEPFWIVGESARHLKVDRAIKSCRYDILKPAWVEKCIEKREKCGLTPKDMFQFTSITAQMFNESFDEYGDSYTKLLSFEETKELVNFIILRDGKEELELDPEDESEFDADEVLHEIFPHGPITDFSFFQNQKVAFNPCNPVLEAMVEFYGGTVVYDPTEEGAVCVEKSTTTGKKRSTEERESTGNAVNYSWVTESFKKRKLLDKTPFKL